MKQKRSKSNKVILKKTIKIISYNFLTRSLFKIEIFNDFIQNINKKPYDYYWSYRYFDLK